MDSYNYPDSGNSSPRSRDVDPSDPNAFFDDAAAANYKLKFMVSYGGKIQPRPHDNYLTYVGGETKLLTVDRHLSLPHLLSRLSSLSSDVSVPVSSFKYQLPGEDLDSLISVSSEDDLQHLFLEYDRLLRSSPSSKPPRMRVFLFPSTSSSPTQQPPAQSSFIDALNSSPAAPQDTRKADPRVGGSGGPNSVDFLLGFEKGVVGAAFRQDPIRSEQAVVVDRGLDPGEVQRQLQLELQRMQLRSDGRDSVVYARKVEEGLNVSGGAGGYGVPTDYYAPKIVEKSAPQAPPPQQAIPAPAAAIPGGYWQEKQMPSVGFPATGVPEQQPMYVIPGAGGIYHQPPPSQAQMVRPVGSGSGQGYYAVPQRFPPEFYQEQQQQQQLHQQQQQLHQQQQQQLHQQQQQQLHQQQHQQQQQQQLHQMYGILPQQALSVGQPQALTSQPQFPKVASGEAMGIVRTSGTGGGVVDTANYAQVMYAAATASGGMVVPAPYQGMVAVTSADMRGGGGSGSSTGSLSQDGKVISKVTQNSL